MPGMSEVCSPSSRRAGPPLSRAAAIIANRLDLIDGITGGLSGLGLAPNSSPNTEEASGAVPHRIRCVLGLPVTRSRSGRSGTNFGSPLAQRREPSQQAPEDEQAQAQADADADADDDDVGTAPRDSSCSAPDVTDETMDDDWPISGGEEEERTREGQGEAACPPCVSRGPTEPLSGHFRPPIEIALRGSSSSSSKPPAGDSSISPDVIHSAFR